MPSANDVYITPASRKIEWYGSSAMKGQIHHDDTNFYVSGTLDLKLQGADDISLMGYSGGSIITFGTDQTERMRLTEAGNFGIGTTGPSAKLHVQGTSKLNDWVYLSGSASQRIGGYDTQIWSIANGGTTPATVRHVFATALDWDDNVELRYQIPSTVGDGSGVLKFGQIQKNNANYSHGETQFFTSGAARLTINKQGRVGINTTSPSHGLTVFDTDFYLNSGDMHISQNKYFKNANDGGQSHGFPSSGKYVFNNVDVGIGTTSPSYKLHVSGAATQEVRVQSSDSGAYSRIQLRSATDGYAQFNMGDSGADGAGGLVYTHSTDTLNIRAANSNVANVTSTGVGIGTTAPTEALHVYSPDTGNQLGLYSDANEVSALNFYENTTKSAELLFDPSANDLKLINRISGGDMIFRVENNTEAMRILNDGNVGIGLDTPTSKLHVKGTLDIQDGNQTILMGAGNSSTARSNDTLKLARVGLAHYHNAEEPVGMMYAYSNGTDNGLVLGAGTSNMNSPTKIQFTTAANDATLAGTVRMQIGSDGRVGIGTTAPAAGLHISSTESSQLRITSGSNTQCDFKVSQYGGLDLDVNHSLVLDVTRHIDYKVGSGRLHRFYENNVEKMRLDNGKLGIGTTSPAQTLDVNGATQTGQLIVTGSTLAVQRTMKNDITTSTTLSDSYSVYQALADGGGVGTVTITAPPSPSVGDTYLIVAGAFGNPGGGGAPTLTGLVRIIANTGQTINGVNTNISLMQSTALQPEYKTAHLVCVDTNTWVMTLSAQAPVA